MPKIGDRVKCNRCKAVWEFELCGSCDKPHPFEVRDRVGICDATWELCPECGTPEEVYLLKRHVMATPQELN